MAMRNASTGQFSVRALFLAAGLLAGLPVLASAQNASVPESHTVRKGDTLWDLAKTYFGDPFTWPQIYKLNTAVVEDPHWIYPGEVLQLTGAGGPVIPKETPMAVAPEPAPAPAAAAPAAAAPEPAPAGLAVVPPSGNEVAPPAEMQPPEGARRGAGPIPGDPLALFGTNSDQRKNQELLASYAEKAYRPLRPGEFYSAGFMSEGQALPYGEVLGDVVPPQISTLEAPTTANQFYRIGVIPPSGASYQVGDSLLIASVRASETSYGDIISPTGVARVVEVGPKQATAIILQQFQRIRIGQVTLPLERFTPGGTARAVPISDGIEASVVAAKSRSYLTEQQTILFLDKGRADGVAAGDIFEVRRTPEERWDAASTVADPMARLQVVRVGEHTSSALVVRVLYSNIDPGTMARQVAKLPN